MQEEPASQPFQELSWSQELAGRSLEIVASQERRICVQAGPGTGKSYCMTKRILRLLQEGHSAPKDILAITFTRTAAKDIERSIRQTLGDAGLGVKSRTLHSLCLDIITSDGFLDSQGRHGRILHTSSPSSNLGFEAAPMLADLRHEDPSFGSARTQTQRIRAFEAAWARRQQDPLQHPTDSADQSYEPRLLAWMTYHKCLLLGELVPLAWKYLYSVPQNPWRSSFRSIFVDEYQDLNRVDQAVIDLLSETSDLVLLGDIDQSIYSMRFANPEGLREKISDSTIHNTSLDICRRCPKSHVTSAQALVRRNTLHAHSYPLPMPDAPDGKIYHRVWQSPDELVDGAVSFVRHALAKGISLDNILVLTPARPIGQRIRDSLIESDIPSQSYFSEELLESPRSQMRFTLLQLLLNPYDRVALRCWLGGWLAHQNCTEYARLRRYCEINRVEPADILAQLCNGATIDGLTINRLVTRYHDLQAELEQFRNVQGKALFDAIFPNSDQELSLIRSSVENLIDDESSATEVYSAIAAEIQHPSIPVDVDHVRIMSLHKSKGLTAQATAIVGCMEGLLPRHFDPEKTHLSELQFIEEQRRLLYVAMTRSKDLLLVASCLEVPADFANRYRMPIRGGGQMVRSRPSRFIVELGGTIEQASDSQSWVLEAQD